MKLIIDIDEKAYKDGQLCNFFRCYSKKLDEIIYNGIPLEEKIGRWIDYGMKYDVRCSICNTQYPLKPISNSSLMGYKSDYCPGCGAKME